MSKRDGVTWSVVPKTNPKYFVANSGGNLNCYQCAICGTLRVTTGSFLEFTGKMDVETIDLQSYGDYLNKGLECVKSFETNSPDKLNLWLSALPHDAAVIIAYERSNGSGHVINAFRDGKDTTTSTFYDYQQNPPEQTFNLVDAKVYWAWQVDVSVDGLTLMFKTLSIK